MGECGRVSRGIFRGPTAEREAKKALRRHCLYHGCNGGRIAPVVREEVMREWLRRKLGLARAWRLSAS